MKYKVFLVKAFSQDPKSGNPAAVLINADSLNENQMLGVTRFYGFSESVFIQKTHVADFKLRYFSTKQEVEFCGHATLAAIYTLIKTGALELNPTESTTIEIETGIGILPVKILPDFKIMTTQNNPKFGPTIKDRKYVADILGLDLSDLTDHPIEVVSTGVNKLIVLVKNLAALDKIKPDLKAIVEHGLATGYRGVYTATQGSLSSRADFTARSFNPAVGIAEDPATGISAGPLACFASKYIYLGKKQEFVIEQGYSMGKPSDIFVEISNHTEVGGYASIFGEEELDLTSHPSR